MTEKYSPLIAAFLRECSMCGAAVSDQDAHSAWHERLRDAVTNGMPTIDVADLDQ